MHGALSLLNGCVKSVMNGQKSVSDATVSYCRCEIMFLFMTSFDFPNE